MEDIKKAMKEIFKILKKDEWIESEILLTFDENYPICYNFQENVDEEFINISFKDIEKNKFLFDSVNTALRQLDNHYLETFLHEIGHYIDRCNQDLDEFTAIDVSDRIKLFNFVIGYQPDSINLHKFYVNLVSEKIAYYYGLDIYNYLLQNHPNLLAPFQKS